MQLAETKGILLFSRDHKEKDKLVKIFTESAGKQMFYVKGAHRKNNPLRPALLNFTEAVYIGTIRNDGLSFLNSAKNVVAFRKIQEDIFLAGYATYLLNLVDVAIEDRVYDPHLFHFTEEALTLINGGQDAEIITNIFEVQLLNRFGVSPVWTHCAVCGATQGKFDYSSKYSGVLCERHWYEDEHRYHADPRAIHFLRLFANISYQQIETITIKEETKRAIRLVLDQLYDEYVGIHLKSKHFIDQMHTWEDVLKLPKRQAEKNNEASD